MLPLQPIELSNASSSSRSAVMWANCLILCWLAWKSPAPLRKSMNIDELPLEGSTGNVREGMRKCMASISVDMLNTRWCSSMRAATASSFAGKVDMLPPLHRKPQGVTGCGPAYGSRCVGGRGRVPLRISVPRWKRKLDFSPKFRGIKSSSGAVLARPAYKYQFDRDAQRPG